MKTKIDLKFEEDVYQKYYPLVYATCRRLLQKQDILEDAVQSVFLLYIKKEDNINSNLSSWFYWASVNICKVVNIETKKQVEKFSSLNENTNVANKNDTKDELFTSLGSELEKLPTKKKEMLLMRYYDNMSYREIGSFFKCKEDSVRKIIERTIQQLEVEIKKREVLSSFVFSQFFGLNPAPTIALSTNKFIVQNSLLQQSFVGSLQKILLISKIKTGFMILAGFSIIIGAPLSAYYHLWHNQPPKENTKFITSNTNIEKTSPVLTLQAESKMQEDQKKIPTSPMPAGKWVLFYDKSDTNSKHIGITIEIKDDGTTLFRSKEWEKEVIVQFSGPIGQEEINFEVDGYIYQGLVSNISVVINKKKTPNYIQAKGTLVPKDKNGGTQSWFIQDYENLKFVKTLNQNLW